MDEMQKIREFLNSKDIHLCLSVKFYSDSRMVEQSEGGSIPANQFWCAEADGEDVSAYVYGASYEYMLNKLKEAMMKYGYSG